MSSSLLVALHVGHNLWQKVISVLLGYAQHLHVLSGSDLFHEGQWFSFGYGDGAEDHSPWRGQRLADGLDERLTEELHLPHLVDDTNALSRATTGTCLGAQSGTRAGPYG